MARVKVQVWAVGLLLGPSFVCLFVLLVREIPKHGDFFKHFKYHFLRQFVAGWQ